MISSALVYAAELLDYSGSTLYGSSSAFVTYLVAAGGLPLLFYFLSFISLTLTIYWQRQRFGNFALGMGVLGVLCLVYLIYLMVFGIFESSVTDLKPVFDFSFAIFGSIYFFGRSTID
jgi:hypothetical protein